MEFVVPKTSCSILPVAHRL